MTRLRAGRRGRRSAEHPLACHGLEEELEDLDVPAGLGEVPAPRVEPVPREQEPVHGRRCRGEIDVGEPAPHIGRQGRHVLRVREDGHLDGRLVRGDPGEALEHLVAGDPHAAAGQVEPREERGPLRVGVQHGSDRGVERGHRAMEERFRRRASPASVADVPGGIHPHEVVAAERRLVESARRDDQFERIARGDDAVVAARAQRPATAMELPADRPQAVDRVGRRVGGMLEGGGRVRTHDRRL